MPSFVEAVKGVWKDFLNGGPQSLESAIEYRVGQIAVAAVNDARRWPKYAHSDVEAQADRLRAWLGNSVEWLKKQWGADASVDTVAASGGIEISVLDGRLIVRSNKDMELDVYRIDGTCRILCVKEGWNSFLLDSGFYILGGRKFFVKNNKEK